MMVKPITLERVNLFKGLAEQHLKLISKMFQRETIPTDTMIFGQGDSAEALYVLLSGSVSIKFKPHDGEIIHVTEIHEGDVFGWSAALGRDVYTSCALTSSASELVSIKGKDLRALCSSNPEIGVVILERLAAVIAERLKNTHRQVVELLWEGVNSDEER
jgi:CRP-like cAMP-binding protein